MEKLHCRESFDLSSVTLISKREDILQFTKRVVGNTYILNYEAEFVEMVFAVPTFIFLDVSLLTKEDVINHFELLKKNSKKIIYLVSSLDDSAVIEQLSDVILHKLVFPCNEKQAVSLLWNLISDYKQNNVFDEKSLNLNFDESLFEDFIGQSKQMKFIKKKIVSCSQTDLPVLLFGETGTGKSTVAKIIHDLSKRNKKSYVHINISNVDDTLAESELFGCEKGAYTDAQKRDGKFKTADGGTLFIDEIGDASKNIQGKLLTILDTGKYYSIGSDVLKTTDVRLICATNADLKLKIMRGEFRKDLLYRIAGDVIYLPTLRERKSDIKLIATHIAAKHGKTISEITLRKLERYNWPGNIRQLQFCLERACKTQKNEINIQEIEFDV